MLDRDGYRPNVGIILINGKNEVFWGKRVREHSWQFPQGGIKPGESPEAAMYRELLEEVGLLPQHVKIVGRTRDWLRYEVPSNWVRREWRGSYKGQKQIWFLLRLTGRDCDVCLRASSHPEFDGWRWNDYWAPVDAVIEFKRDVYIRALTELSRFLKGMESYDAFLQAHAPAGQGGAAGRRPAGPAAGSLNRLAVCFTHLASGGPGLPFEHHGHPCGDGDITRQALRTGPLQATIYL